MRNFSERLGDKQKKIDKAMAKERAKKEARKAFNADAFAAKNLAPLTQKYAGLGVAGPQYRAIEDISDAYFGSAEKTARAWDWTSYGGFALLVTTWFMPSGLTGLIVSATGFGTYILADRRASHVKRVIEWNSGRCRFENGKLTFDDKLGNRYVTMKAQYVLDRLDPLAEPKRPGFRTEAKEWLGFQKYKAQQLFHHKR